MSLLQSMFFYPMYAPLCIECIFSAYSVAPAENVGIQTGGKGAAETIGDNTYMPSPSAAT